MSPRSPRARRFNTFALVVTTLLLPRAFSADSTRVVFTHPPTDMANVASIVPLGSLNPGGGHVLPVDHMYINYQAVPGAADRAFRVDAMANGSISHAWDVGVIDTHVSGDFVGRGERRYPTLMDYMWLLGVAADPPFEGQQTLNAACFLSYMTPEMRAEWWTKLISSPQGCGQAGWDVRGRLRGAWFSDAVDAAPDPPLFALSSGELAIVPDVEIPSVFARVSIGAGPLSPIDPSRTLDQLRQAFRVAIDRTPGTRVNPDPALVRVRAGSVCYDLQYGTPAGTRYNTVLFNLMASWRLRVRYDATPYPTAQCAIIPLPEPDETWAEYRR